ncbi:aldose epimerase family protein [Dysgonomonas sp. ZJ279]|uniref:aldose epimerase family protein n=1 Tax=Dysgonomonas sp. ZJ279 TaxID=2709796 RepID=UPI0013EB89F0|nr:aldose epimerase family protein [Dysgonomonas sp. ZJ279]
MTKISIQQSVTYKQKEVILLRLTNTSGSYIEISNYGASIVSIVVPNKEGVGKNVILSYNNLEDYFCDMFYLGSTIGRYANRISNGRFTLNGQTYQTDRNDGQNSNHGGYNGFNTKIFDYRINENNVIFYIESPDGEGGFSGNLKLSVTYFFSDNNELSIEYKALSDKATPVNFTNHSYFNLNIQNNDILDHELQVNATQYLEMNDEFLPIGKICSVTNSAFDFREYKPIGKMAQLKKDNLKGYNAYFIKDPDTATPIASLREKVSGRIVDVYTSMPGIQIYTGDFLEGNFVPFGGICLEAQYHPDGVNHPCFETNILTANEEKSDFIRFKFSCKPSK